MSLVVEHFIRTGLNCIGGRTEPSLNSQKSYKTHILQFETFLKARNKTSLDGTVTSQDMWEYVEHLKSKYQPNSIATKIAAVRSYFKWLKQENALIYVPKIQSQLCEKTIFKELSNTDWNIIVKNMSGNSLDQRRDLAAFALIVYCGFTSTEIAAINIGDLDFENAQIAAKKQKRSFLPALKEMEGYVHAKKQAGIKDTVPFFLNKYGNRLGDRSIRHNLTTRIKECGSYGMRDLRETYLKNVERIKQQTKG